MSIKFNNPILWPLTAPLALVYAGVLSFRNWLYDMQILKSHSYKIPIVNIGNLAVGGTGKTPHIDFLINVFKHEYKIASLSRGYGRKTKGFLLSDLQSTVTQIGDESFQIKQNHPEIIVALSEDRNVGVQKLLQLYPDLDLILLDDAFQHRSIKPSINIMLSDFSKPFFTDFVMPMGTLRECRNGYKRADAIIVTKCPKNIDSLQRTIWGNKTKSKPLYWSRIVYKNVYNVWTGESTLLNNNQNYLLVTGIANPKPISKYLADKNITAKALSYSDHYEYSIKDVHNWINHFATLPNNQRFILTTEKDIGKIICFKNMLQQNEITLLKLPINCEIEDGFATIIDKIKDQIMEWHKIK